MSQPQREGFGHRRARVGSVAVGYLGASWLILQIVDVVGDIVPFPPWIAPGVLIVLGLGLVLVVATAWIQADPDTTRREQTGELPSDWQLAPKDALTSLLHGQFPHLTWGRTLLGGVVALSLLFGAAGVYVLATDRAGSGPLAATNEAGAIRVAAMPFTTTGPDLDVYREGMVELLATNLDGLGDIRAIASRTVLARWDESLGDVSRPDLGTVLETARSTGASHALVGGMVAAGDDVRLTAQLFDLATGTELPVARSEGPATDILALVDDLSVTVVRSLLGSGEAFDATGARLASLTTPSVPALRLYLQAEAHVRRGEFGQALPLLDEATNADPTFGLAVMRRAQAMGWLPDAIPADTLAAARLAIGPLLGGMSQRDATLAEAGIIDFAENDADGPRRLREFVVRYPDDAEGWYQLSDFLYHLNHIRGGSRDEVLGGFDRAVDLGPQFAPYYIHGIESALLRGDSARTRVLLERYRTVFGEDDRWAQSRLLQLLLFHPDSSPPAGVVSRASDPFADPLFRMSIPSMSDWPQAVADIAARYRHDDDMLRITAWLRAGRWQAIRSAAAGFPPAIRSQVRSKALKWAGAFGLAHEQASLIQEGPVDVAVPDYWTDDPDGLLDQLLAARDDGTGADPVLLAHTADRAGDTALAETLFIEESWREFGPAMTWRLAKLYEATERPGEAVEAYNRFLTLWSGADPDLPPVVEAREALVRLGLQTDR